MKRFEEFGRACRVENVVRQVTALMAAVGMLLAAAPAYPQFLGAAERAAARAAARSAARSAERRAASRVVVRQPSARAPCRAIPQKCAGLLREDAARRILAGRYPNERIQSETYLLNRDGSRAIDPVTKQARRIDFVLFSEGRFTRRFEVTSQFADKRSQLAIEQRILTLHSNGRRRTGPVYIYDREGRRMVPVPAEVSKLVRFN